jgi:hypothetical protein
MPDFYEPYALWCWRSAAMNLCKSLRLRSEPDLNEVGGAGGEICDLDPWIGPLPKRKSTILTKLRRW